MSAIATLAAVVVDCRQAAPLAAFYQAAFGGEIFRTDEVSAWLRIGGLTPDRDLPRGRRLSAANLPSSDVPAEEQLHQLGEVTAEPQPPGPGGLLVRQDPAGHLFCICARPGNAS